MEPVNAYLVNRPGSRRALNTPALLVDLDRFEANLAAMAAMAGRRGVALRPHAKTHKCAEIARRQIAAGAIGQCCAKLGEAEALASAGISGLLLTSPVVTDEGIGRLMALAARHGPVMLVVDHAINAVRLADAARGAGVELDILVDMDVGLHRTGVTSVAEGVALAQLVAGLPALRLRGMQAYAGHAMHVTGHAARKAVLADAARQAAGLRDALVDASLAPDIVTGAGTGSFDVDPGFDLFTELQVGSYIFMDREYDDIWADAGETAPFQPALFVQTTVVSANQPDRCTTDAGCKAFATEAGAPRIVAGAPDGARYAFFGDEQGQIVYRDGTSGRLSPGDLVQCLTPHCDPTVNLYDHYHVVRGDELVALWPIDARGRSQ